MCVAAKRNCNPKLKEITMKQTFLLFPLLISILCTFENQANNCTKHVEIIAPLPFGELLDKITILVIKREKINDTQKRVNIDKEYELLIKIYTEQLPHTTELHNLIEELFDVNKVLWDLEDLTRAKEHNNDFDEEFKQLVMSIIDHNDKRFKIKRALNILLSSPLVEEKSYENMLGTDITPNESVKTSKKASIICIPISLADLLDRISILEIKQANITNPEKLTHVKHEYETLTTIYNNALESSDILDQPYLELLAANKKMWDIQDCIRNKIHKNELDQEFTEIGRSVYYANDERVKVKKNINTL